MKIQLLFFNTKQGSSDILAPVVNKKQSNCRQKQLMSLDACHKNKCCVTSVSFKYYVIKLPSGLENSLFHQNFSFRSKN